MKILLSSLLSIYSILTWSGYEQAPPNFNIENKRAVFVDFISANYEIEYKTSLQVANVVSTIVFKQNEDGYPLFDLTSTPSEVSIDGQETTQSLVSPPGYTTSVRVVNQFVKAGQHTLVVKSRIQNGIRFNTSRRGWYNVSNGFFIRDLRDRMFLEQYLPTNLEYDQYKMRVEAKVSGTQRWHSLFANGKVTKVSNNHYIVDYPDFYTASSVYFHLVPINKFVRWYLKYTSIDGRQIPVTIYSNFRFYNYFLKKKAWKVLAELESDYGPWPHDKLIIYGTGLRGGMEHAGATETSLVSLGHELQHSYFAKGVHPANGNSGWLDEAIASWRDKGHQTHDKPFYHSANLAAHNLYTRKTDKRSYEYGRSFMAYLDYQLKEIGKPGLKDFLREFFHKRKYTTVTTENFKSDLEEYAQMSFKEDFFQYIYGGYQEGKSLNSVEENPHHPELSLEELLSII